MEHTFKKMLPMRMRIVVVIVEANGNDGYIISSIPVVFIPEVRDIYPLR